MTYGIVILIFVVGFIVLYAAYRYGPNQIFKTVVFIIVILIFLVTLLDIAGLMPANYLNRRI